MLNFIKLINKHSQYVISIGMLKLLKKNIRGEWPSGLNSARQVTEVGLGRVRPNSG